MFKFWKLRVSPWFLLLLSWVYFLDRQQLLLPMLFFCAIHEVGHYIVIQGTGHTVKLIKLTVIGAEMIWDGTMTYGQELAAAAAGPLVNLLLAGICTRMGCRTVYAHINLMLGIFNLLPVWPLDGGRVLHTGLSWLLGPHTAAKSLIYLGKCLALLLLIFGIYLTLMGGSCTLLFVACWLIYSYFLENQGNRSCLNRQKQVK